MGTWAGDDYRDVPLPEDLSECNKVQRRAYLWQRVDEEGHPTLIDKPTEAERLDVSLRQVYYDMEAVREFVSETLGTRHVAENVSVFEKAKREALRAGEYKEAVDVLMKEAEWLADRGAIEEEPDKKEVSWREFISAEEEAKKAE